MILHSWREQYLRAWGKHHGALGLPWLNSVFPTRSPSLPPTPPSTPQLSAALMFDAVHVVVSAVRELNRSQEIGVKPLACTSANIWPHGTSLMNYLRMVSRERGGPRGRGSLLRAWGHSLCTPAPHSLCLRPCSPPLCSLWPRPSSVCAVLAPFLCPASSLFTCGPSWSLSLSLSLSSPPSGPLPPLPLPSSRPAR